MPMADTPAHVEGESLCLHGRPKALKVNARLPTDRSLEGVRGDWAPIQDVRKNAGGLSQQCPENVLVSFVALTCADKAHLKFLPQAAA